MHLEPEQFRNILASLRVQSRPDRVLFFGTLGPIVPAFNGEDLTYLSIALATAFSKATPEECVVFGLNNSDGTSTSEVTTGSWYFTADELHLMLANYRTKITVPDMWESMRRTPLVPTGAMFYDFVPAENHLVSGSGGRQSHWTKKDTLMLTVKYNLLLKSVRERPENDTAVPQASIRERLEQLKQLHNDGLIPEAHYQQKMKELMDEL
jgi:hypothetical protein